MIYKDFQGLKLSALGMGTMRLPIENGDYSAIDEVQTENMVEYALKNGVNYFDTAWGYHNGQSEIVIGKTLGKIFPEQLHACNKIPRVRFVQHGQSPGNF